MPKRGGAAKTTTNHDIIRRWVEDRGGCPAMVKRTGSSSDPGVLRIDYPGYSGVKSLKKISWEDFFDKFEENNLAFLYQERTATGRASRFSKLVAREGAAGRRAAGSKARTGAAASGRAANGAARKTSKRTSTAKQSATGRPKRSTSSAARKASTSARSPTGRAASSGASARSRSGAARPRTTSRARRASG